jgi:prephenate dehydratase
MRLKLGEAFDKLYNQLLPKQINSKRIISGIQGGKGSFNEEAILYYLNKEGNTNYQIKYLHTSEDVLAALHNGEVDRGLFAIQNSTGGLVEESIQAMARYKFRIIDQFAIKISHALMVRDDVDFSKITTIMSHPQVFAQCKDTLSKKYPHLAQISGEGKLVDHALVAKLLFLGKLPKHVATMGSKILAKMYKLTVIEENLQDAKENFTSFLLVGR